MKFFKSILIVALILEFGGVTGQTLDQKRLERDLKIAEDVVKSLFKSEGKDGHFYSVSPKASYIDGYGILINLNGSGYLYSGNMGSAYNYTYSFGDNEAVVIDNDFIDEMKVQAELAAKQAEMVAMQEAEIATDRELMKKQIALEKNYLELRKLEEELRSYERKRSDARDSKEKKEWDKRISDVKREVEERQNQYEQAKDELDNDELEDRLERIERRERSKDERAKREAERARRIEERAVSRIHVAPDVDVHISDDDDGIFYVGTGSNAVDPEVWTEVFQNVAKTFFADYADLIGQLKNDEKIMLLSKNRTMSYGGLKWSSGKERPKLTAEVSRSNISNYKSGKLSKDKFIDTIKFTETEGKAEKKADLELLSTIFQRMYKADLATTYYTSSGIRYEYLENVGAIFRMRVYSSISSGRDSYRLVTQNKSGLTKEERDQAVNGMYPQFEQELKSNILDYGKTVKSLKGDESLRFEVRLTECRGCEMPQKLEVSVKQSVLADYNAGKINRDSALKQMTVKKS